MRRAVVAASALAAAALSWSPAAASTTAAGDQDAPGGAQAAVEQAATTTAEQRRIVEYWTPHRTRSAVSGDAIVAERDRSSATGHVATGRPTVVPNERPTRPGRENGTVDAVVTTTQWKSSGDFDYDIGFAVMNSRNGVDLTEAVGAQSIGFNLERGEYTYAFGYPATRPYDGTDVAWCHGAVMQDTYFGSQNQGMRCTMTGGSSGGPWLVDYDENAGVGTLNSVNSFGYRGVNNVMWGPYFGTVAQELHRAAEDL